MAGPQPYEGTLTFDNFDIDLVLKVASHTIFGPFFTFFVPFMYKGMGAPWTAPTVYYPSAWFLFVTLICTLLAPSPKEWVHIFDHPHLKGCSENFRTSIGTVAHPVGSTGETKSF